MRTLTMMLAVTALLFSTACGETGEQTDSQTADTGTSFDDGIDMTVEQTPEEPELVYASHVLIPFQGCVGYDGPITHEEALAEVQSVRDSVAQGTLTFEEAAAGHSTCPSAASGGFLGSFPRGAMVQEFEEVAFGMEDGELSEPFETQYGYHIVLRHPIIRASHILAAYQGSVPDPGITRTREEALLLIQSVRDSLDAGMTFTDAAAAFSDCPSSQVGGDLGPFSRNIMDQTFEDSAFVLDVDQMSGIVETPFGFHLILRTE